MKWGFLFLSGLVASPIADGVQAWQRGAPFSLAQIITGIIKEIYTDKALIKGLKGQIETFCKDFELRSPFFCW
jgi:hypothetical protein